MTWDLLDEDTREALWGWEWQIEWGVGDDVEQPIDWGFRRPNRREIMEVLLEILVEERGHARETDLWYRAVRRRDSGFIIFSEDELNAYSQKRLGDD